MKRALPQEFCDKTTNETIKRIKSSTISEFKSKSSKIRYEANNNILEKIDDAIYAIEKGHIERCQERLKEAKALILKQQKLIRIADREEDGREVVKCYLSDNLASDSEDEKQLNKARRERQLLTKRNGKVTNLRTERNTFRMPPFSEETLKPSVNRTKDKVPTEIISEHQKYVISAEKKDISSMTVPFEEQGNFDFTYKRDWEITEKIKNVSVRGRLKQNIEFWKNELKPSYFVENIITNGYIMPFTSIPSPFYASNNRSSLRHPQFVSQAITKLQQNKCVEELKQKPYCCNPLTVAEGKKLRLVLDLRHVNKHIKHNKFRYENLSTLSEMLNKGDYFTTFDLTSGYHHIEIHPEHRKFLVFEWTFEDGSR